MSTPPASLPGPENRMEEVPRICNERPEPYLLTGFLVSYLQRKFSQPEYLRQPRLRHLLWKSTPDTGILITESLHFQSPTTEKRPALIVSREDLSNTPQGINNEYMGRFDLTGGAHHATLLTGAHVVACRSTLGPQAELLAAEVYYDLLEWGPLIGRFLRLARFRAMQLGKPRKLEEAHESIEIPVVVQYGYLVDWMIRQHAPVLKRVALTQGNT